MAELKVRVRSSLWNASFLFAIFWAYIIAGGVVFKLLEHNPREEHVEEASDQLEQDRATLLSVLWAQTIASTEEEWLESANERLDLYEQKLKGYLQDGIDLQDDVASAGGDEDNPWTLIGAVFYCYTVVTTIGYGNLAPATTAGKVLTIVYGTVGIPLTLVLLAELGKLLTLFIKAIYVWRNPDYADDDDYESDEYSFTLAVSLGITGAFLVSGALFFGILEDWSWEDAAYFSFITFSTIGFGDLVPENQGYVLLFVAYSLTALGMMAMCIGVLQVWFDERLCEQRARFDDWIERCREQRAAAKAKKDDDVADRTHEPAEEEEEVVDSEIEEDE